MGLSTASPSSGDPGQRPVRSNEVLNLGPYTGNEPNYSNDGFEMGRLPSRPENEAQEPCSVEEKSRGNWRIAAIMLALSVSCYTPITENTYQALITDPLTSSASSSLLLIRPLWLPQHQLSPQSCTRAQAMCGLVAHI